MHYAKFFKADQYYTSSLFKNKGSTKEIRIVYTPSPPPQVGGDGKNWFHMDLTMFSNPFPDNSRIIFDRHGEHVKKGVVVT